MSIDLPDLLQGLHYVTPIDGLVAGPFSSPALGHPVFEHPDRMFPMIVRGTGELVQNLLLFHFPGFQVPGSHYFYQLALALLAHHVAPPTGLFAYRKVTLFLMQPS